MAQDWFKQFETDKPEDDWFNQFNEPDPVEEAKKLLVSTAKPRLPISTVTPEKPESVLSQFWKGISEPLTDLPSRVANTVANRIDEPRENTGWGVLNRPVEMGRGFVAGATQGLGNILTEATSPVNIAGLVGGLAPGMLAERGLMGAAKGVDILGRVASAPIVAHGGLTAIEGAQELDPTKVGTGLLETAGGIAGLRGALPKIKVGEPIPQLPPLTKSVEESLVTPRPPSSGVASRITVKKPTPETIAELIKNGYQLENAENPTGPIFIKPTSSEVPSFAREGTKVKIGADVSSLGKILGSSLYQGDIGTIATKELVQNSLDAIRPLGPEGKLNVIFDDKTNTVHVEDNGKGLTPDEVASIFTDLGSSGKRSDEAAIGGFGLAKASFLLGGKKVRVETIAAEPSAFGTRKIKTILEGTPDELLAGIEPDIKNVANSTPTGTKVTVSMPENHGGFYSAREFVDNIKKHSEIEGQVNVGRRSSWFNEKDEPKWAGSTEYNTPVEKIPIAELEAPAGKITLLQPKDAQIGKYNQINLYLRNKGMYQGRERMYLGDNVPNIPDHVIVDIDSMVPEGSPDYPFTANREGLRGSVQETVKKYIQDELVNPARGRMAVQLQEMYANMPATETQSGLQLFFHDTGSRYTPDELNQVMSSPAMHNLGEIMDNTITQLKTVFPDTWTNRLERLGFVFDDTLRGVHIPNPGQEKPASAILLNPLVLMKSQPPDQAAAGFVHTLLHEFAHVDPKLADHNESFTVRLGDVYEKFGARNTVKAQDGFLASVTDDAGNYTPEVQELLQRYIDSRGRDIVKQDVLSGTGVSAKTTSEGPGGISDGNQQNGAGVSRIKLKALADGSYDMNDPVTAKIVTAAKSGKPVPPKERISPNIPVEIPEPPIPTGTLLTNAEKFREYAAIPRAIQSAYDVSFPFRQGIGLIHTKGWWQAWPDMVKSFGDEEAYRAVMDSIAQRENFIPGGPKGTYKDSFAGKAGLAITDLGELTSREEMIGSRVAEKIPGIRASNRAYTAFANKLRADVFDSLIREAEAAGLDPRRNLDLAKSIANYVNNASGRGSLAGHEAAARTLNELFFSPRLMASRVQMLNPANYLFAPPIVRKQYWKSLGAIGGAWVTFSALNNMLGGETNLTDPTSAEFGRTKVGETRFDPSGGFLPYLTLMARLGKGSYDLATSNPKGRYTGGYGSKTPLSDIGNFFTSKAAPLLQPGIRFSQASKFQPFEVGDQALRMFTPIMIQDLSELMQTDPTLIPFAMPQSAIGIGVNTYERGKVKGRLLPQSIDPFAPNALYKGKDFVIPPNFRRR